MNMNTIEIIIMFGVVGNFLIQGYWLYWSKSIHDRKHFTDEKESQKEIYPKLTKELADAYMIIAKLKNQENK